jgi:hypothetical protein
MNGVLGRGLVLATLAAVVGGPGCVSDDTQDIVVKRALLFDPVCKPDVNGTGALASGGFDVMTSAYVISLEVISNVVQEFTEEGRIIGGRRLFIYKGVDVTLTSSDEAFKNIDAKLRTYIVPGFGTIEPTSGVGASGSTLAATLSLLPGQLIADPTFRSLASQPGGFRLFASMEVFGTLDGSSISANTVDFAIDVCDGCLLKTLGPCDQFATTFVFAGNACFPGQDAVTQCCTSPSGVAVCPGKGTKM